MKPFFAALGALVLVAPTVRAQDAPPLAITRVAQTAKAPAAFAPRGWKTESVARGDLNRDGRSDAAIVLVEDKPALDADGIATDRKRALVIALNRESGWQRVGFSNQLLMGTRDGGAFYGVLPAPVEVSIEKGVVIVEMEFGSREVTNLTYRLRYEPARRAVYVIGRDANTRDRAAGGAVAISANYLTGVQKTTTYAPDNSNGKTVTEKIARDWRWLGAVTENDRYNS